VASPASIPTRGRFSDVYQDVLGEGSFIGKGIYDVDAFERALAGKFPDNHILSHDLLEGCYARSGLLSDVQLYEEFPASHGADMNRRHRWIRGDWQLAGWLLPLVPGPRKTRVKNPLSMLSRWKLFDNLRRSLVPAALTATLLLGWTVLPHAGLWTLVVLAVLALPSASAVALDFLRKPAGMRLHQHLVAAAATAGRHAAQIVLALAFLPYEATVNLDAIARTAWRMLVSRRRLLQWNPSADDDVAGSMWIAPVIAGATALVITLLRRRPCRGPRRSCCCGSFPPPSPGG
jgi:hypothetical protein